MNKNFFKINKFRITLVLNKMKFAKKVLLLKIKIKKLNKIKKKK